MCGGGGGYRVNEAGTTVQVEVALVVTEAEPYLLAAATSALGLSQKNTQENVSLHSTQNNAVPNNFRLVILAIHRCVWVPHRLGLQAGDEHRRSYRGLFDRLLGLCVCSCAGERTGMQMGA